MTHPTLFDVTPADVLTDSPGAHHRDDPPTSVAAANSVRSGSQRAQVLAALVSSPDGLTGHEACELTSCAYPHSATTRLEELARLGLCVQSDRTRTTPSGRQALVWSVTGAGRLVRSALWSVS